MRCFPLLLIAAATVAAYADPPPPSDDAARDLAIAHALAARGDCAQVVVIGTRVARVDPDRYQRAFVADDALARCLVPVVANDEHATHQDYRDPTTALWLSAGITAGGLALVVGMAVKPSGFDLPSPIAEAAVIAGVAGLVVGPTVGHIYAGHTGSVGLGLRAGSLVPMALGALGEFACGLAANSCSSAEPVLLLAGAAGYVTGTVLEIATAGGAARDHDRGLGATLSFTPVRGAQKTVPGVGIVGKF